MQVVIVILLSVTLSDMARGDIRVHATVGQRPSGLWQTTVTSVVPLSKKPCIFQSKTSPSEFDSLRNVAQNRIAKKLVGPEGLLNACRAMRRSLGPNQCQKIFVGGHGIENGVGVRDLFSVYATDVNTTEIRYQQMQVTQPNPNPNADNWAKQVARKALVVDQIPCTRSPKMGNFYMGEILACFETLIDRSNINNAIVFSSCGPKTPTPKTAEVRQVCAQVLSDATNIPVVYSKSTCRSLCEPGNYDTCEAGHEIVRPTYNRP